MERESHYIMVGAFVLLVVALAAGFVLWYTDRGDKREYARYEIYFDGSVSGLSEGSAVRYLGVPVGRVVAMNLDQRAPDRVQVLVDIDRAAPVSEETLASLSLQGVTGLLYIDLQRDQGDKPVMPPVPGERYPVIRSVKSDFDLLIASLPELFTQASSLIARVGEAFSDENIDAISRLVSNTSRASGELPEAMREVRLLIGELRQGTAEIQGAAAGVRQVMDTAGPDITATLDRVRTVAVNLAETSRRLEEFVDANNQNISRFTDEGLGELRLLIRDSRRAALEFRELSRSLKANPAQLIYEQKYPGVEIAR
jgi:phospholipid/cholesterol/gamma-HCH transport system substrate-binding protein